jgi:HlyD family secretion protein
MKKFLVIFGFIGIALAVLYGTGHLPGQAMVAPKAAPTAAAPPGSDRTAPAVSVATVSPTDFIETVLITGSVVARDEILITPEIEGFRVVELLTEEGDTVRSGQVLARLSSDTLEAQVAQNDANLARSDAAIAVARSSIVQAEASVKEAANAFDRTKSLKQSGYASSATYDQRESAALNAQAKVTSALDGLKSAQADRAAFEASRRELIWRRSKSEIRSPVDGMISRRTARVGSVVGATSDAMFRVIARGEVELDAEVAESDMGKIKEGQPTTVTITGAGDVTGNVRLVSSEVDRTTRLGKVRVFFGKNPALRLGAFGRGTIETARSHGLAAPTSAVVYSAAGASVLVVKDGRVATRKVVTGLKTQASIEILSGLVDGDTLVAKSGSFLRNGDAVRAMVLDAESLPAAAGGKT